MHWVRKALFAGGGRYDGLVEMLGGEKLPAVGFALGVERLYELVVENKKIINLTILLFQI